MDRVSKIANQLQPVDVLATENSGVAVITLNRPQKLNSLSLNMIRLLTPAYTKAPAPALLTQPDPMHRLWSRATVAACF